MMFDEKFVERFRRKLRAGEDGHVLFAGGGRLKRVEIPHRFGPGRRRRHRVRRVAWMISLGPVPAGLDVVSGCGVDGCVEPSHLQLLPHAEAAQRASRPPGELHVRALLTPPDVAEIRAVPRRPARGTLLRLAHRLGISYDTVLWLRTPIGRASCWKDVP